jgi:hypothetical protein
LVCALAPAARAQTKIEPRYNMFSEQQDIDLGKQASKEYEKKLPLLNDAVVTAYVNEIGGRLTAKARGPKYPYSFRVVNSSDLNAFALPGGPLFLNRGVLESARNDGEVAGVLAHEIAHVVLRHGTANMTKATITQQGFGILGGLLGSRMKSQTAGDLVNMAGGVGAQMLILKYSRDAETEADVYGAQILARSGYNPGDMSGFFETLEKVSKSNHSAAANFLSDHPTPDRRVERINEEAALLKLKPARTTSTTALGPVQAALKKLPAAPKASEQVASGKGDGGKNAPGASVPSTGTAGGGPVNFPAPAAQAAAYKNKKGNYKLSYPSNWQVVPGEGSGVVIAPPGGVRDSGGKSVVVAGAVINRYAKFGNEPTGEDDGVQASVAVEKAFDDLRDQVLQGHPELVKVPQSGRAYKSADGTAKGLVYEATPKSAQAQTVTIYAKQLRDRGIVYVLFVTPQSEAAKQGPALKAIVESLGTAAQ